MEPAHKTLPVKPNGVSKKSQALYRECLKNHAASLGGHALDGCGEFMASPTSKPSDPTSLTCAACGCHRNFHRRLPLPRPESEEEEIHDDEEEEEEEEEEEGERVDNSSAPHMLLALSGAGGISPKPQAEPRLGGQENGSDPLSWQKQATPNSSSRKRFRTKFSPQQKEKMHELSEVMGWKMSKRDEVLVENRCREIGIGKGVFKVWMHNNKHNFVQSPSSSLRSNNNNNNNTITTAPATITVPVTNGNVMILKKLNGSGSDAAEDN